MTLTIKEEVKQERIIVDLTGEHGNAFAILGLANKLAKKLCLDSNQILTDMKKNDYGHLIRTFEKYFGDYVELQMDDATMKQVNPFHHF